MLVVLSMADSNPNVRSRELDLADAEPFGVRVTGGFDHLSDPEEARVAVTRGNAYTGDPFQLGSAHRQEPAGGHGVDPRVAVLLEPGVRDLHGAPVRKPRWFAGGGT